MKNVLLHIVFLVLCLQALQAQSFRSEPEQHEMLIGEQTAVHLKITYIEGAPPVWPVPTEIKPDHITIVEEGDHDTSRYEAGGKKYVEINQKIIITSFDTGLQEIQIPAALINGDSLKSEPFFIDVRDVDVDEEGEFADIKEFYQLPLTLREILKKAGMYLLIGWGALVAIAVILFFIGNDKPREKKKREPAKPQIPEDIAALEALDKLKDEKLWQAGKYKEYHIKLSEISRAYLERRFRLNAMESTTGEIERQMRALNIEQELKDELIRAYRISDLAKFAKVKPLESENEFAYNIIRDFVEKTRRKDEPIKNKEE